MKVSSILKQTQKGISFEFFPPKQEKAKERFKKVVEELKDLNPLYASMTYGAGGTSQDSTVEAVDFLRETTDFNVVPHLTCIGASKHTIDKLLTDYKQKNINNIFALRGDPPRNEPDFDLSKGEFTYSTDLIAFIKAHNHFSIGIALYPQIHPEAASLEQDLEYAKRKIEAGADFGATQMFFENKYFYKFRDTVSEKGIDIPIMAGIMPVTNFPKIKEFASFCNATLPKELEDKMTPYLDQPSEMKKIGIEFAIEQCNDLIKNGVSFFHFFTLNQSGVVSEIIKGLNL